MKILPDRVARLFERTGRHFDASPSHRPPHPWRAAWPVAMLLIAGCAAVQPPQPPSGELALPEAAAAGLDQLMTTVATPSWLVWLRGRAVVVEPARDQRTLQQTRATQQTDRALEERLRSTFPQVRLLPFVESSLAQATWAVSAQLMTARAAAPDGEHRGATLQLALLDMKTGARLAQTEIKVRADTIDPTPTMFFQDSPVMMSIPVAAATGSAAVPAPIGLFEALTADAMTERASGAYEAGAFGEALALFESAKKLRGADALRVETGLYLAYSRLGREAEAKRSFGTIASIGIERRSLGVKFLFEPGKVEFWADPVVSAPYDMWLEEIADRSKGKRLCLNVVGHASHTGTSEFNNQLSLNRAIQIGEKLARHAPELALRLQETGMGFRENLIGSGTDDVRDALDRRVEFRFDDC